MMDVSKANLSGPMSSSVVKGSKLINKVWFQNIKPKLYLMKSLDMSPLSEQTHFNFIHALGALRWYGLSTRIWYITCEHVHIYTESKF